MPKSALIQPDSISVKGQMHDIGGQKLGPVLADIFYSPLILRYLGEFPVKELQAVESLEVHTWLTIHARDYNQKHLIMVDHNNCYNHGYYRVVPQ